jgi:hypothetical protein
MSRLRHILFLLYKILLSIFLISCLLVPAWIMIYMAVRVTKAMLRNRPSFYVEESFVSAFIDFGAILIAHLDSIISMHPVYRYILVPEFVVALVVSPLIAAYEEPMRDRKIRAALVAVLMSWILLLLPSLWMRKSYEWKVCRDERLRGCVWDTELALWFRMLPSMGEFLDIRRLHACLVPFYLVMGVWALGRCYGCLCVSWEEWTLAAEKYHAEIREAELERRRAERRRQFAVLRTERDDKEDDEVDLVDVGDEDVVLEPGWEDVFDDARLLG